jgi:hypothetical protein
VAERITRWADVGVVGFGHWPTGPTEVMIDCPSGNNGIPGAMQEAQNRAGCLPLTHAAACCSCSIPTISTAHAGDDPDGTRRHHWRSPRPAITDKLGGPRDRTY